ncbi:MAG: hypothetical protein K2J71_01700 [Oscillospiraceae bacterium]|nr:hypothetical protein [Oscillospiraceae bacterium]
MFVYENVPEQDKILYEKVSGFLYRRGSKWCVDRENKIYIVCIGKHGVETPVVFHIWFKNQLFEFMIPEPDILYGTAPTVYVKLPAAFASDCSAIEAVIKRAFRETMEISNYGSLPRNINDHIFEFEERREKTASREAC